MLNLVDVVDGALEFVIEVLVEEVFEMIDSLLIPEEDEQVDKFSSSPSNMENLALLYLGIKGRSKLYILYC